MFAGAFATAKGLMRDGVMQENPSTYRKLVLAAALAAAAALMYVSVFVAMTN